MISLAGNEIYCFFKSHFRVCLIFLVFTLSFAAYSLFFYKKDEGDKTPALRVGLVNEDESLYSEILERYISENKTILKYAVIEQGTREEIEEEFAAGNLSAYLIIPPNLMENMSRLENTPMKAVISGENPVLYIVYSQALRQYEKYIRAVEQNCQALYEKMIKDGYESDYAWEMSEKLSLNLILIIMGREKMFGYEGIRDLRAVPVRQYYFYSFLSLLVLYGGLLPCYNMVRAKRQGVLERNISVMSNSSCFLGMALAGIVEGLYFFLPLLFLGKLFGISAHIFGLFLLMFTVSAIILQGITFLLLLTTTVEFMERVLSTAVVLFFFFLLAGGALIPISYLPEKFLYLSKCTPVYWLMVLFCR